MTILVGLTGGIGSGKSTFSKQILKRKLTFLDSDVVVDSLYTKPSNDFLNHLRKIGLGNSIKKKSINKKMIAQIIFNDNVIKFKLQNYIYKFVRRKRLFFIKNEKRKKTKVVFLDIPLLLENNLHNHFDVLISIISTKNNRYNRLKKSKKISKSLFYKILKSQTTDVERKKKSDIVIYNNNSMKVYLKKTNKILDEIVQ